jgi:hypothetical protein
MGTGVRRSSPRAGGSSPTAARRSWALAAIASAASACVGDGEPLPVDAGPAAIAPHCEANVIDLGLVDVERRYLPQVVACENASGGIEALKAQAVAARSYLYYRMESSGSIRDGTRDQVFSCTRRPTRKHRQAVDATAGQILAYGGEVVAGFFVAGALPEATACKGAGLDRFDTERFVTYNRDQVGEWVEQTLLGFRDPRNVANRGAMSQHGANCLASEGWRYDEILRFYYGGDIDIVQAEACERGRGARSGPALLSRERVVAGALVFAAWIAFLALASRRRRS